MNDLAEMLRKQLELQQRSMKDGDPRELGGDARAEFVRWNILAATDELHEALQEVGWKPWATSRHLNGEPMLGELVDAWHFIMNCLLVIAGEMDWTIKQTADTFIKNYNAKNEKNAQRQKEGYDGIRGKCSVCHRELPTIPWQRLRDGVRIDPSFCSFGCLTDFMGGHP